MYLGRRLKIDIALNPLKKQQSVTFPPDGGVSSFFFPLSARGPTRRRNSTGLAELWDGWPIEQVQFVMYPETPSEGAEMFRRRNELESEGKNIMNITCCARQIIINPKTKELLFVFVVFLESTTANEFKYTRIQWRATIAVVWEEGEEGEEAQQVGGGRGRSRPSSRRRRRLRRCRGRRR